MADFVAGIAGIEELVRAAARQDVVAALTMDLVHEKQQLAGHRKIKLLNSHGDPSFLHTVLSLEAARDYLPAPKANFMRVVINDLNNDTFYARIILEVEGETMEVDSRPSDAIALAVRCSAPVLVAEHVMDKASITPEANSRGGEEKEGEPTAGEDLDVFRDFVEGLDLEGLGGDL